MFSTFFLQAIVFYGLTHAESSLQFGYVPVSVKTPYLNAWIASNAGSSAEPAWPNFYATDRELGWAGLIRVDNESYQWMGHSGFNYTTTLSSYITPTKSILTIQAGPMQFNVTFLTPVEPDDYVRQSIPFTYMYIDGFAANDSKPHSVQVYSDISGQWVSRADTTAIKWDTIEKGTFTYHRVESQTKSMTDNNDFAEDGVACYAMLNRPGLTWQTGQDQTTRALFATNGNLSNARDTDFRPLGPINWPVFGFAVDLETISPGTQPNPVVSALGLVRNPLITYTTELQSRVAYYTSQYATLDAAIAAFLSDFQDAQRRNAELDNRIMNDANKISSNYAGILALATRSIFSAMDITIPSSSDVTTNSSEIRIFMKDMGTSTRTNPVDVIYGALPALLYFNASLAHDLLEPLLEFQSGPSYPNPYAAPDLGSGYPTVLGNTTDTQILAVESTGSMLIMVYAHAVKSGDRSLINRYYPTLSKWADYLVVNALSPPEGSMTCDGPNTPNSSNLAIKGILGIYSMAKINEALSVTNTTYMEKAIELFGRWQELAIANNRIYSEYGKPSSSGLIYNLFPAVWLNSSLVSQDILSNQAQFYAQQSSPYVLDDSLPDVVFPYWTLLTAATIPPSLSEIRNRLIDSEFTRVHDITRRFSLPMTYGASDRNRTSGNGRSNLFSSPQSSVTDNNPSAKWGAAFGILALNLPDVAIQVTRTSDSTQPSSKINVGAIVGGVIGGLAFLLAAASIKFFLWRRRKQEQYLRQDFDADTNFSKPRPFNLLLKQREAINSIRTYHRVAAPKKRAAVLALSKSYLTRAPRAEDLRVEIEQLRREMNTIRDMAEPPPVYQ